MDYPNASDNKLIRRFRKRRDQEALGALYLRYMDLVYGVCLKYLAQPQAAQDAVMDIYEHINLKLSTHEVDNFGAWLYRVSRNHCLQILRKKNNLLTVSFDEPGMQNGLDVHQEDEEFEIEPTADVSAQLAECLALLPEPQQQCIRLFYFEKQSYADISEGLTISLDQVRSHIQNGRRNLKKCMTNKQRFGSGTHI